MSKNANIIHFWEWLFYSKMTKFFKAPTPLMVRLREKLLTVWNDENQQLQIRIPFSNQNPEHIGLIRDCTQLTRDKLTLLQAIDVKIVSAFALGLSAFLASWVFPLTYLAVIGFSYAAYQIARRQQVYADYNYCLENLEACCAWSVGPTQANAGDMLTIPAIEEMLNVLCSVMSKSQLHKIIAANVQNPAIAQSEQRLLDEIARNPLLPDATIEQQRDLLYRLYGQSQGSSISMIQCLAFIIRHAWRTVTSNPVRDAEPVAITPFNL